MFQISNIDEKSEWNLNEAHIIIPMIDGDVTLKDSEKILTNTITFSSLEGGDQAILASALEHSFVIGLDKTVFETPNYKSDLVIIQNSDLKFNSCNTDLKNPVAYTISYVDQDKCEILWQSTVPKDKICASDRAILEVRDVLNYNDSEHELQKTEQINLNNVDTDLVSQVTKTNNKNLIEKTITDEKSENKSQFINYFEAEENTETVPILQQLDKSRENLQLEEKKLQEFKSSSSSTDEDIYKLEENAQEIIFQVTESAVEFNESQAPNSVENNKTDEKIKMVLSEKKDIKVENNERENFNKGESNSLPEKNLPLKKKAKMKRTSEEDQKSLLKQDVGAADQEVNENSLSGRKIEQPLANTNFLEQQKLCQSNYDKLIINKISRQKKVTKFKSRPKKLKRNITCCLQEGKNEFNKIDNNATKEGKSAKIEVSGFDENKFSNTSDLIDCLRKCRMINAAVWQTLNSGLKEIKVDILKEMNAKKNEKYNENVSYSPQLKAFALVLYFKQPAAFNYLSQIYKNGWPSFNVIKKWKRRMNSCQRPKLQNVKIN